MVVLARKLKREIRRTVQAEMGLAPEKENKFHNRRVKLYGHTFDSIAESERYFVLEMWQRLGEISGLVVHPKFPLVVNGVKVTTYEADFEYLINHFDISGSRRVVEDVKSKPTRTRLYLVKKALMKALLSIEIKEILS